VELARAEPERVANVRYADLRSDAVATTHSIYERLGMNPREGLEDRIGGYLRAQRSGRRAAPPRSLETFGYQADSLWTDPAVNEYCDTFGVERERSRLVDTRTGS
jgi:hypothetical protein